MQMLRIMSEINIRTCSHSSCQVLKYCLTYLLGTAVAHCLSCCATNRKVAGSIPDGVIGIFHWHNTSDRSMTLGSTQPLTEMSTTIISWGKSIRCLGLTTLPPSCTVVMKSGKLNFLEPSGPRQACNGLLCLYLFIMEYSSNCSQKFWIWPPFCSSGHRNLTPFALSILFPLDCVINE